MAYKVESIATRSNSELEDHLTRWDDLGLHLVSLVLVETLRVGLGAGLPTTYWTVVLWGDVE